MEQDGFLAKGLRGRLNWINEEIKKIVGKSDNMVINTNDASNVELSSTPHRQGLFIYNEYGNTDHRVSSPGIQN